MKDLVDLKEKGSMSPQISWACFKPEQVDIWGKGILFLIRFRGVAIWAVGVLSQPCSGAPLPSIRWERWLQWRISHWHPHADARHSSLESTHRTSSALQPECRNQPVPSPAFSKCFFLSPNSAQHLPRSHQSSSSRKGTTPAHRQNSSLGCTWRQASWEKKSCFLTEEALVLKTKQKNQALQELRSN